MNDRNIDDLRANPKNPRTMKTEDAQSLKLGMTQFGDLSPIVFNVRTNQLVGGHQRINVLTKMMSGAKEVLITERLEAPDSVGTVALGYVIFDGRKFAYREVDWEYEKEMAANIAANRVQGDFNIDMLSEVTTEIAAMENSAELLKLTGQNEDEIKNLLKMSGVISDEVEEDEAPEVDAGPAVSKVGEIYQLGRHRVMCGDSTDFGAVSDLMDGVQAEMVFTDPPYGYSYQSNYQSKHEMLKNDDKIIDVYSIIDDFILDNTPIYVCAGFQTIKEWLNLLKYPLKNIIVWKKNNWSMGDLKGAYAGQYELIIYSPKGRSELADGRDRDVWEFDREAPVDHPTTKPVGLICRAIRNHNAKIVLDLFLGSGSTLMACEQTERTCYGMELDPKYVDVIRKRYARHIGKELEWELATPAINADNA